jgi:hypothetical protein
MMQALVLALALLMLSACSVQIQDEATDPRKYMPPSAEGGNQPVTPTLPPSPPPARAAVWTAWVLRKVMRNGDVRAGYAIEINLDAPVAEAVPPLHPIPVAPLYTIPKAASGTTSPGKTPGQPAQPGAGPGFPFPPTGQGTAPRPFPQMTPGWPPGQGEPAPVPVLPMAPGAKGGE